MFAHSDIWKAIDRLAASAGYSASGLAKKAGLDPTTFNKSKRTSADGKPRWPSTESIAKILSVTGLTMTEFFSLTEEGNDNMPRQTIPLIGYAQAGREGYFDSDGYPAGQGWDRVTFPMPAGKAGSHIYALEVSGDSMAPFYREGDVLIVSPDSTLRKGDRVIVRTEKGEVMAKELARRTASRVELRSFNPDHKDLALKPEDIQWMARIMWVSQ